MPLSAGTAPARLRVTSRPLLRRELAAFKASAAGQALLRERLAQR